MTISEAIKKGIIELKSEKVEYPMVKARILMQFVLNKSRQYIIVNDMKEIEITAQKRYCELIEKLKKGIPLEYITNKKEFMKLDFYVDENVLIPRQDTEILVEEVIQIARKKGKISILDLCTGSGAIAVSLAKYLPEAQITAVDISNGALQIAKKNADDNNVQKQIEFIKSDMFENIKGKKFDIIVSNPPYIKHDIINNLDKQVKNEPHIALDGGKDGLDFYRIIVKQALNYLKKSGYLCLEIGFDQKNSVIKLLEKQEYFNIIYSKKDLYGNDRIVVGGRKT